MVNTALFEYTAARFDMQTREALRSVLQQEFVPKIELQDGDARFLAVSNTAFDLMLTLKEADGIPADKEGYLFIGEGLVYNTDTCRYVLYGTAEDMVKDLQHPIAITFEDAICTVQVYNSTSSAPYFETPWEYLCAISHGILHKQMFCPAALNDKERALLPLIKEVIALDYWLDEQWQAGLSFPNLRALAEKYGIKKALPLFDRLSGCEYNSPAFNKTAKKITALLNLKSSEGMFYEIKGLIDLSQADYPARKIDCERLPAIREQITALLHGHGFSGTYPDFYKEGDMKGIHLTESYDVTYFVGMEKHVTYRIRCMESMDDDYLTVQFLCGTALLKKGESADDIIDCLFDAKGRRLFATIHYSEYLGEPFEGYQPDDLSLCVKLAVKKVQLQKLTKQEQIACHGMMLPGFGMFLSLFIIGGGLFGVMMTVGMMLICALITAIFGMASEIPAMLAEMPWGFCLAFCWISFGGIMGLLTVLAKRK